jgi:hypothetical protein
MWIPRQPTRVGLREPWTPSTVTKGTEVSTLRMVGRSISNICTGRGMSPHCHSESPSMAAAAMPLAELERWLQDRADRRPVAASIPMLDGYVAAIVAGPVSI